MKSGLLWLLASNRSDLVAIEQIWIIHQYTAGAANWKIVLELELELDLGKAGS